jgi:bifunctional UDP-N-acetylglucosamine pyrophosphorylase / glucosamine-1-phosphate N-acetyltransferase
MANSDFVVGILATARGARFRSSRIKVLQYAGGLTLIEHTVRACKPLKPRRIVLVVGEEAEKFSAAVEPLGGVSVLQRPPRGTGNAIFAARRALGTRAKYVIVLPADASLVRTETLTALAHSHRHGGAAATILSAKVANPVGYRGILRYEDGTIRAIAEESPQTDGYSGGNEVDLGIYAFTLEELWPCINQLRANNRNREFGLHHCIAVLCAKRANVLTQMTLNADEILVPRNDCADLAEIDLRLRRRKRAALMDSGVTIQMPETVLVDPDVVVGADTMLEPRVQLLGRTRVGTGCIIRTGSILSDVTLKEGVVVEPYSIASESHLAAGTRLGPFSHLRFGVRMMKGARIGNFVEAKQSTLAERAQAKHLSYLGDAQIGSESTIGAGTITCNYDGVRKNPTTIGSRVFVGSDTTLVAPVHLGNGAYVGAGSTITDNVPADALALGRERQINNPSEATPCLRPSGGKTKRKSKRKRSRRR